MSNNKSAVTLCVLLLLTLALHGAVRAQSEERKLELGIHASGIGGGVFKTGDAVGGGGRVTYNVTKYVALEGELNYFTSTTYRDLRSLQGQFGIKSGLRYKRFGVFGKVRPGFINTKEDFSLFFPFVCNPGPASICFQSISATDSHAGFSLDVGGVAEVYTSKRVFLRFDVGDTIANRRDPLVFINLPTFGSQTSPIFFNNSIIGLPGRSVTSHNLQLSIGVGFRL